MSVSGEEPSTMHFGGALQPLLKIKADELFLRWLGESETQRTLGDLLQRVKDGGPLYTKSRNMSSSTDGWATPTSSSSHESSRRSGFQTGLPCTGCSLSPADGSGRRCRRSTSIKRGVCQAQLRRVQASLLSSTKIDCFGIAPQDP